MSLRAERLASILAKQMNNPKKLIFRLKVRLGLNLTMCSFNSIFLQTPPNFMCIYEYPVTAKFLVIYSHLKLPAVVRKEEHIFQEGEK